MAYITQFSLAIGPMEPLGNRDQKLKFVCYLSGSHNFCNQNRFSFFLPCSPTSAIMLTHYSRLWANNPTKTAKLTTLVATSTPIPSKVAMYSDFSMTVGLVFGDQSGTIHLLTNLVISNIEDTSFDIAGNLSDSTTHFQPCSLQGALEVVPVIAPRRKAHKLGLKIGSVCPTTLDAPGQDSTPPNLADLGFVDSTNGTEDAAIIALTGAVLAWPMGIAPPTGNFLTGTASYPQEGETYLPGVLWFDSLQILWRKNGGKPLHVEGPFFDSAQVLTPADSDGLSLSASLSPVVLALPIGTPVYNEVMEKCHEHLSHATAISTLATAPPMVTITPQGAPPTAPQGFHEFTTAMTDTFRALANQGNTRPSTSGTTSLSLTDQGKVASLKVSTARQQLLLATIVTTTYPDGTQHQETMLPTLSAGIMGPMSDTSQFERCTHVFENWRHSANRLTHNDRAVWIVSFIDIMRLSSCFDSFWAKCLLMGTWAPHANPAQFPSSFTQMVSVFNFLVPYPESKTFLARSAAGHLEQAELMAEEHPNKRQKTNTKLTLDGKQHQHSHLMAMLANLYSWFMFMVELPDTDISPPENPVIIKVILLWANLFKTPEAKAWFEYFNSYSHLVHSVILDINASLTPIFQLLGEQEYRVAATDNVPIPVSVYAACLENATYQVALYTTQIRTCRLNLTSVPPSYGGICCPIPAVESTPVTLTSPIPRKKTPTEKTKPFGTPPASPANPAAGGTQTPGIVTWTKDEVTNLGPPKCSTIWHSANGRTGRLCTNFMIKGMVCKGGTQCRFVHLNKISDLSPDNRRLFSQWVTDNPTLSFPPSRHPGSPPTSLPGNTPTPVTPV